MRSSKIVKELDKYLDKLDEIIASIGTEIKDYNDIRSSTYVEEIIVIPKDKYIELLDLYDNLDDLKDRIDFNSWCKMDKDAYINKREYKPVPILDGIQEIKNDFEERITQGDTTYGIEILDDGGAPLHEEPHQLDTRCTH